MSSAMLEIKDQFLELQKKYQKFLPKVDPELIDDLLLRLMEIPRVAPMYMIEVFTKPGLDTEEVRSYIIVKTGMSPAIYDKGTHYVTNQELTLDMLKEISDSEDVIEVTGEYTGGLGGYGASHEHKPYDKRRMITATTTASEATALAGFIISGGLLPNANVNRSIPAGIEPGSLHGHVTGPGGLPAVGATVLAVQQGNAFVASSFVSITGDYDIQIPPGNYVIYVAYPDGTDETRTVDIQRGSLQELNFAYQ